MLWLHSPSSSCNRFLAVVSETNGVDWDNRSSNECRRLSRIGDDNISRRQQAAAAAAAVAICVAEGVINESSDNRDADCTEIPAHSSCPTRAIQHSHGSSGSERIHHYVKRTNYQSSDSIRSILNLHAFYPIDDRRLLEDLQCTSIIMVHNYRICRALELGVCLRLALCAEQHSRSR